jgi:ABC-type transport system substrate-binding protein
MAAQDLAITAPTPGRLQHSPERMSMLISKKVALGVALTASAAVVLAACGSSSGSKGTPASSSSAAANPSVNAAAAGEQSVLPSGTPGQGVSGGTLKVVGQGDVDHLDTASGYYTTTYSLFRAITRQLVQYPTTTDTATANTPTADAATYTVSPDGLTYTFNIKQGVMWDAPSGARQVTSADEVLGIKRLCNPYVSSGAIAYYTGTIVGMTSFCNGFAKAPQTVAGIKAYIDANQISGITTPTSSQVVFTLTQPASDFLNIMALPFASPAPIEDLNYLPDSPQFRRAFISDGPYKIDSYSAGKSITLSRNPDWQASTDPLRKAYVDNIDITEGESDTSVQQQLQAGTADFEWDTIVPTAQIKQLYQAKDPKFMLAFNGSISYLPFNLKSPALASNAVREALQYCVNKQHLIQVGGGSITGVPSDQILPPQLVGYKHIDPYATPNAAGDPTKCESGLKAAGASSLTLRVLYSETPPGPAGFQALQNDLGKEGIKVVGVPQQTTGDMYTFEETASNLGKWDIGSGGWVPDWQGNSARSFFVPLLDGSEIGATTTNYGNYNDATVNADIKMALSATTVAGAAAEWAAADNYVMTQDPAWVPVSFEALPQYFGPRVKNAVYNNFTGYLDMTNVWVN